MRLRAYVSSIRARAPVFRQYALRGACDRERKRESERARETYAHTRCSWRLLSTRWWQHHFWLLRPRHRCAHFLVPHTCLYARPVDLWSFLFCGACGAWCSPFCGWGQRVFNEKKSFAKRHCVIGTAVTNTHIAYITRASRELSVYGEG